MATTTKQPDVIIELTLPVVSGIRKLGSIVAKQGRSCVFYEFEYVDMQGIGAAIQTASSQLALKKQRDTEKVAADKAAQRAQKPASASTETSETDSPEMPAEDGDPDDTDSDEDAADVTLSALGSAEALTSLTDKRGQTSFI